MNAWMCNNRYRKLVILALLLSLITAMFGGLSARAATSTKEISKLVLSKNTLTLAEEDSETITATAIYEDGSSEDVTIEADWSSEDGDVATVYAGTILGNEEGSTIITATYMGISTPVTVTVEKKVISLTKSKSTLKLRKDGSEQVNLTATYKDGTTETVNSKAEWKTSDDTVATVTAGLITGVGSGTTTVTAEYGDITVTINVRVDIARRLVPDTDELSLSVGGTYQLELTGLFEDGSEADVADLAEWSSDDTDVADVFKGLVTAYKAGTATLTASYGTKAATVTVDVDVAQKLTVSSTDVFVREDASSTVTVTATYLDGTTEDVTSKVEWSSSDESIANAKDGTGTITGYSVGEATLTASYGTKTATVNVDVGVPRLLKMSATSMQMSKGSTESLTVTATYSDGTTEDVTSKATWTSSDTSVVYVAKGQIQALASGEATITAAYGGISATTDISVDVPRTLKLSQETLDLKEDGSASVTVTITYTDGTTEDVTADATWTSSDKTVATVYMGTVTAVATGQATITATYLGKTANLTVNVAMPIKLTASKTDLTLEEDASESVTLTAVYSDETSEDVTSKATWASDNESVAYVKDGNITAVGAGEANITGTYGGKTATITVSVGLVKKLKASETELTLKVDGSEAVTLTATYSDGTTEDVTEKATWTSSDDSIAYAVKGTITGVKAGTATITGTYEDKSAEISVSVGGVTKLEASETDITLQKDVSTTVTLTASYFDGTEEDVTSLATWTSSNQSIAYASKGKITAVAAGEADITATYGGASTTIHVEIGVTKKLVLSKTTVSLKKGGTASITATAYYTDGTTEDVTSQVTWNSENEEVAYASKGTITAYASGETTLTATYGGKSASVDVEVDTASSLKVSSSSLDLQEDDSEQLTLTVTYSDGTTEDVTDSATWTSTDTSVATVSKGLVQAVGNGNTTIKATFGKKTVSVKVSVGEVNSLSISDRKLVMSIDDEESLTLTAKFADGTKKDVTKEATWTSSSSSVAEVSSDGVVTAIASGKATITATYGDSTITVSVEVAQSQYLTLNKNVLVMEKGDEEQLELTATFSDGSSDDVTDDAVWSISSSKVGQVINGKVTAYATGKATITAKFGGKTIQIPLEVEVAKKLTASVKLVSMKTGDQQQIELTATYSDDSTKVVTTEADWSSRNFKVADVSSGLVTAAGSGKTTIVAKYGGKTVNVQVEVDILKYLQTSAKRLELSVGESESVTLTATYSDATEGDVTSAAVWKSSNDNVADVKDGVITAYKKGTAVITAKYSNKTAKLTVVVK